MPPSPALRCSPGRELRSDSHRRGRSLESGLLFKDKDEDLTLFSEMQSKERESFLLQSTDDFEDTFSAKLRHFSDIKLGISVPVRGESSDLLNADGEKNDYDWLLTPPDTPLFPSLDDEPPPVSIASRGRPQSKPISISRSSTMEKSYRSRGSASPNRLSPSPRSGSNAFQSRGRPSSAPHSSPTPSLRHGTPSRKPSPPPSKASTPTSRSSTPTPRRISTGSSSATVSSGVRGTSPMKTSRGTSASPKIRAWQMNIPGFSSEAPPNLRTSLADRPASYVRGSSPASRNSRGSSPASRNCRDSTSKFSRQSMSPTASRSGSSFHTHDRDQLSSHSKGSIASSVEDDVDSLQSIQVGSLDRLASRRVSPSSNNRALTYSKKSARMMSSNSAPKRSFDSALRQMDHRKSPQNMFRPLLSSVPSTTFYVGKSNSTYRPLVSRNSSVTTSSNASSDQGTSFAPDTEGSDLNLDDMASESDKLPYPDHPEEVFSFDKMDVVDENIVHEMEGSLDIHHGELNKGSNIDYGSVDYEDSVTKVIYKNCKASQVEGDISELGNFEDIAICSRCGCQYDAIDQEDKDSKVCEDCSRKCALLRVIVPETFVVGSESSQVFPVNKSAEEKPAAETEPMMDVPEFPEDTNMGELWCSPGERALEENQTSCSELIQNHMQENPLSRSLVEEGQQILANQQELGQPTLDYTVPNNEAEGQQFYHSNDRSNLNVDISEGTGISVLLKRSSSIKEPVIRGRPFTASTVPYGDLSFARDSANSMRGSSGHRSFSPSSSADFSSSRQTEIHVQRQFSGSKLNIDFYGYDINLKPQSIGSSFSGTSNHSHQGLDLAGRTQEDSSCNMRYNIVEETPMASQQEQASEYVRKDTTDTSLMSSVLGKYKFEHNELGGTVDAYRSELSSQAAGIQPMDISETSFTNHKDCTSYGNDMDLPSISRSTSNVEVSVMTSRTSFDEEHGVPNTSIDEVDAGQIAANSFLITESEKERENRNSPDPLNDDLFLVTKSTMDHFQEISGPDPSNDDLTTSTADAKTSENPHSITEESSIMVECQSGSKARSLTLEEATDTILFCSSIIHDLAYQAATIAMEKENSVPLEASRPMVTVLGKSNADRKNSRSRVIGKRTLKSPKTKQRRVEIDAKPPPIKMENDENRDESLTRNVGLPNKVDTSMKPPKLESKCNCTIM